MAEYKVTAVSPQTKPWSSQYGDMVTYYVKVEGREDVPVQVNKKASSPAPQVGEVLNGEINRTEYGDKFKATPKAFGESPKLDQILKELADIKHILIEGTPPPQSGYEQARAKADELKDKHEVIPWD
jgi:hypothetical protein